MSRKKQNNSIDLWEDSPQCSGEYLVLAGINKKTDRQLYLSSFDDCNKWSISVVPYIFTLERATKMVNKAIKEIEKKNERKKIIEVPTFEIVSVWDCQQGQEIRRLLGRVNTQP